MAGFGHEGVLSAQPLVVLCVGAHHPASFVSCVCTARGSYTIILVGLLVLSCVGRPLHPSCYHDQS